ncbi:MAG: DUF1697 domain-containing protein [Rhodoglobus sp.]
MISVALFRNLNLGHSGSPSGAELVEAFGGPGVARSFQTNGTVVFEAANPEQATTAALTTLRTAGYTHTVIVQPLHVIQRAIAETPATEPSEDIYRSMISFYMVDNIPGLKLPLRSPDRLVEIRTLGRSYAHSVCWKPRHTAGNATGYLEQLLDTPVTTRTTGTLHRLIQACLPHPVQNAIAQAKPRP